jgi:outer membrane lipoprotein SlyB
MASSIEDILMAKAMADAESRPDPAVAMGGGAAVGGVLGALPGIGGARGRMAGGLVGAILGGGLGMGARQMMIQDSPAASILAKMQAQGTLNPMDRGQLQSVLKDIYNNPGM